MGLGLGLGLGLGRVPVGRGGGAVGGRGRRRLRRRLWGVGMGALRCSFFSLFFFLFEGRAVTGPLRLLLAWRGVARRTGRCRRSWLDAPTPVAFFFAINKASSAHRVRIA